MNRNNPAVHFLPTPSIGAVVRGVRSSRVRARCWLALELAIGVGCEVALELASDNLLHLSSASGLGVEAAAAVGLGLVFGLRRH